MSVIASWSRGVVNECVIAEFPSHGDCHTTYNTDRVHWINCLPFATSAKQERTGLIAPDAFKGSGFILARRKGPAQDHAMLLCCILLGCKKQAFVCKGTVYDGDKIIEHTWVATLETEKGKSYGHVVFWEPSNGRRYVLPKRWDGGRRNKLGLGKMELVGILEVEWTGMYFPKMRRRLNFIKKQRKERKRGCDLIVEKIEKKKDLELLAEQLDEWLEGEDFPSSASPTVIRALMLEAGLGGVRSEGLRVRSEDILISIACMEHVHGGVDVF